MANSGELRAAPWILRGSQLQAPRAQGLDHFLDRLATEVRDRVELRLRLLQEVADGLDAGALQAVVGADAELELLDQDVVHPVRAARRRGAATRHLGTVDATVAGLQRLQALLVGEDGERLDEDL